MPTVLRQDDFRFFFYSNENNQREPAHIHVLAAGGEAKFWLAPDVALASSAGLDARMLRRVSVVVAERREELERAWHDHFT